VKPGALLIIIVAMLVVRMPVAAQQLDAFAVFQSNRSVAVMAEGYFLPTLDWQIPNLYLVVPVSDVVELRLSGGYATTEERSFLSRSGKDIQLMAFRSFSRDSQVDVNPGTTLLLSAGAVRVFRNTSRLAVIAGMQGTAVFYSTWTYNPFHDPLLKNATYALSGILGLGWYVHENLRIGVEYRLNLIWETRSKHPFYRMDHYALDHIDLELPVAVNLQFKPF